MRTPMTSRQRVQAALRHEEPDCVPIDFGGRHTVHVEVHRALKQHLGLEGGAEIVRSLLTNTAEPDPRLVEMFGGDVVAFQPRPGASYTFRLDPATDSWADEWGIRYRRPPGGHYYDPCEYPLASAETVAEMERYPLPNPTDPARLTELIEPLRVAHASGDKAVLLNAPAIGIWRSCSTPAGRSTGPSRTSSRPASTRSTPSRSTPGTWTRRG